MTSNNASHEHPALPERPELLGTQIFDLTGRVALITGGGRGLGETFAYALAAAGADIVVSSRTAGEIEQVAEAVRAMGRRAEAITCDITDEASVEAMVSEAVARMGHLDILVNNAGMNIRKPILEITLQEWQQVLDTNLKGYFLAGRAAGRVLVAQGHGKMINIGSIFVSTALPAQGPYASSKGAIMQLTRVMALEWAKRGVQVNLLSPTYFETEMTRPVYADPERKAFIEDRTPMGRWGQPHELAGSLVFLASHASDFITGQELLVDGGYTAW